MTRDQEQSQRRFRFSLITLLVAVSVAGVLIWANVSPIQRTWVDNSERRRSPLEHDTWGWPLAYVSEMIPGQTAVGASPPLFRLIPFSWLRLLGDMVVGIGIVVLGGFMSEFLVRRFRKGQRHDG